MRAWPLVVLGLFVLAGCAAPSAEIPQSINAPSATVTWSPEHPVVGDEVLFGVLVTPDPGTYEVEWIMNGSALQGHEVRHVFHEAGFHDVEARVDLGDEIMTERFVVDVAPKKQPEPTPTPAPSSNTTQPPDDNTTEPDNETAPGDTPRPPWASLEDAKIRPGVRFPGCTTNFVFTSPTNGSVYIGTAAHCGREFESGGCDPRTGPRAPGTTALLEDEYPVEVVYNSWHTMIQRGETDPDACSYNDFMLLRIMDEHRHLVNPVMLHYGGPTCLAEPGSAQIGDEVFTYGRSGLRFDISAIEPRRGIIDPWIYTSPWTIDIRVFPTPGIPGDSGSPVTINEGCALGVVQTLGPGSNGVSNLALMLDYANKHAGWGLELATGELLDPLIP